MWGRGRSRSREEQPRRAWDSMATRPWPTDCVNQQFVNETKWNGIEWNGTHTHTHTHSPGGGGEGKGHARLIDQRPEQSLALRALQLVPRATFAGSMGCRVAPLGSTGGAVGARRVRSVFGVSTRAARYRNCDPQSIQQERSPFTRQLIAGQRHGDAWHRRRRSSGSDFLSTVPRSRQIMAWLAVPAGACCANWPLPPDEASTQR